MSRRRSGKAVTETNVTETVGVVKTNTTVTNNERCFNQFNKYLEEKSIETIDETSIKSFIVDCANGWPNNKPKKESSLNIKYRGIVNYLKSQGEDFSLEKGFVRDCLQ